MRLDHVSYAVPSNHLGDEVQRLGAAVGAAFTDGGRHPRFGTRNFVLPLAGGTYFEVVSALDHPAADRFPFGQAVKRRADDGGGWMTWVIGVDDISPIEQRLGRSAVDGNRHRPDGVELHWKQLGLNDVLSDPQVPYFVQWNGDSANHPGAGDRDLPRIERIELAGDSAPVDAWLDQHPTSLGDVAIDWVDGDPGLVAVHVATRNGSIRLD